MSDILRCGSVTLHPRRDATAPAMNADWTVEVTRAGVVGELQSRALVPAARRAGIAVNQWSGRGRAQLAAALRLLADHLFVAFGLHRLDFDALDTQSDVLSAALQAGFIEEGRHRHVTIVDGLWRDRLQFGLLEDERREGMPSTRTEFAPPASVAAAPGLPAVPSVTAEDFAVLRGRLVTMRRKQPSDKELLHRWLCRPEWWRLWMPEDPDGFSPPTRQEFDAEWREEPSPDEWIVETEAGLPLGRCFYCGLDTINRSAEAGFLLYEPEHWGRGYGTDALSVLLRHLFHDLKLHRVSCGTWSGNIGSSRVQQKNGLRVEARKRDAFLLDGEWYDGLATGILEDEFHV